MSRVIVSETTAVYPQFYDLDPLNIVWHGNYPRFFELARTSLMTKIGYGYDAMVESGYAWPIIDMHIRYYRPLRLNRRIDFTASISEWENRLKIDYLARDNENGQKMTKGHTVQVAVDIKTQSMLWKSPDILREKLRDYL